ncbi:MAG: GDP-L-fucose synthase [Puniceicoccaceae bacterium]|nr:MAG: GDP-L-fucose synthase [Puniceicoccaceae bacterium]
MKKLLILGSRGMVGSALVRAADHLGYSGVLQPSSRDLDLTSQAATHDYLTEHRPDEVIVAAAMVGGIHANSTYPADFMYKNLMIATNAIEGSYQAGVRRLIFLGSTCIYPKFAEQPIKEESLLTSALEATNEAYAIAKISGLKMCEFYRRQYGVCYHSAMPTNLYGQGDNYHPQNSHVLPALIRRFHEAKRDGLPEVAIWGTGKPLREFLHADDAAAGILHLLQLESPPDWVNLGCGIDISIGDLARLVMKTIGYEGELTFDASKPDGTPRKLTDISKITATGWAPRIAIEEGVSMAYQSFLNEQAEGNLRE